MSSDSERLTILEMEYRIVAGRLNVIEAELAKMNEQLASIDGRLGGIDGRLLDLGASVGHLALRTEGTERGVTALLRHFKVDPS